MGISITATPQPMQGNIKVIVTTNTVVTPEGFENGTVGWTATGCTLTQDSTHVHSGSWAGKMVVTGSPAQAYVRHPSTTTVPPTEVNPGASYTLTAWVYADTTPVNNVGISIDWLDYTSTFISTSQNTAATIPANTWTSMTGTFTAPANAAFAQFGVTIHMNPAAGTTLWVDDVGLQWNTGSETFMNLIRIHMDGTQVPVRTYSYADSSGQYLAVSDNTAVFYDVDAPFNEPVTYSTADISIASSNFTSNVQVILQDGDSVWFRDPLNPAASCRAILTTNPSLAACRPGEGLVWGGMDDQNAGVQSTNWSRVNNQFPITQSQIRAAYASSFTLYSRSFADRDVFMNLCSTGHAVCMDLPAKYGYSRRYIAMGDVTISRLSRDQRVPYESISASYASVATPGGQSYGTFGLRWQDMAFGPYFSIGNVAAAGLTWGQVMMGAASQSGFNIAQRYIAGMQSDLDAWQDPDQNTIWTNPEYN